MIPRIGRSGNRFRRGWVGLLLLVLPAVGAAAEEDARVRALALYDEGRYSEARPLLEQLEADGAADGVLLYRLYYCQLQANDPASRDTLQRARDRLEQEAPTARTVEGPFYLANAYRNVGRLTDAKRVASEATGRLETGQLPAPENGIDFFRVGKLYEDQDRVAEAVEWYTRAMDAFTGDKTESHGAYVDWAADYLAQHGEPTRAAEHLARTLDPRTAPLADLDRLAVLQVRAKRYDEAFETWTAVERRDPANADRARYSAKLAKMASAIGELPEAATDERPWSALGKDELNRMMVEQAAVVRGIIEEANQIETLKKKRRKQMQARIDEAKALFVAAGLETSVRRLGIREAAFFGGYAPLIFRPREWELPEDPR